METFLKNLKTKLNEIYSKSELTSDELYELIISKSSNEDIYSEQNDLLNTLCLYMYYKQNDLQSLTKKILPFDIDKNLPFDKFCESLSKYKLYSFTESIIPNDTYYDLVYRALVNREKLIVTRHWKQFTKSNLEETKSETVDNCAYKIYLPISNDSLELFSMRLLAKCNGKNINYDFKINNDSSIQRSDNVVIYATAENFNSYIEMVNEIVKADSRIKVNYEQQHLLAFPLNNFISVAPYTDNNGKSYSEIICDRICEDRKKCSSYSEFENNIVNMMVSQFSETNNLENSLGSHKKR